jgi:Flp pilus assembly protein TadD
MGFFGFGKKKWRNDFNISYEDRKWVEQNFDWMNGRFGPPREQVSVNEIDFHRTFAASETNPGNMLADLCDLLNIDPQIVRCRTEKDFRDIPGMPYQVHGRPFTSDVIAEEDGYTIVIAHFLLQFPKHLLARTAYECVHVRLKEGGFTDEDETDIEPFIHLACIHFGLGIVMSHTLIDHVRQSSGGWETKWNFVSTMPQSLMAFALAEHSRRTGNSDWKSALPAEMQSLFEGAQQVLGTAALSASELSETLRLMTYAIEQGGMCQYAAAVGALQKALLLTQEDRLLKDIYNNLGYYQALAGLYEESIPNFHKALLIDPQFGYAHDNLGYALIRSGKPEEGRNHLEKALKTKYNDDAYSYRNLALYYMTRGELEKAGDCFQKAFDTMRIPVDLLEFHYAEYLLLCGKNEEALLYLEQSVQKGEPKAIQLWNKLHS